jgi:hypothetical protein
MYNNFDAENQFPYASGIILDYEPFISEETKSHISKTTNDYLNEFLNKSKSDSTHLIKNQILSSKKIIKKYSNFNIPQYVNLIKNEKERRKEIQRLKNRESAQISRDRKKREFDEQKLKIKCLKDEIDELKAENKALKEKLLTNKCENCGFYNIPSDLEDERLSRSSYSTNSYLLYPGLTLLLIIGICCWVVPNLNKGKYTQNNGSNVFVEIINPEKPFYDTKNKSYNDIKEHILNCIPLNLEEKFTVSNCYDRKNMSVNIAEKFVLDFLKGVQN